MLFKAKKLQFMTSPIALLRQIWYNDLAAEGDLALTGSLRHASIRQRMGTK